MAKTPNNPSIGNCECPVKGCSQQCTVHQFRQRENKANSRFAGRYFVVCPKHGRMGGDPKDTDMQAYIKAHAKMQGASSSSSPPAPAAEKKSKSDASASPEPEPEPKGSAKSNWWGL